MTAATDCHQLRRCPGSFWADTAPATSSRRQTSMARTLSRSATRFSRFRADYGRQFGFRERSQYNCTSREAAGDLTRSSALTTVNTSPSFQLADSEPTQEAHLQQVNTSTVNWVEPSHCPCRGGDGEALWSSVCGHAGNGGVRHLLVRSGLPLAGQCVRISRGRTRNAHRQEAAHSDGDSWPHGHPTPTYPTGQMRNFYTYQAPPSTPSSTIRR